MRTERLSALDDPQIVAKRLIELMPAGPSPEVPYISAAARLLKAQDEKLAQLREVARAYLDEHPCEKKIERCWEETFLQRLLDEADEEPRPASWEGPGDDL